MQILTKEGKTNINTIRRIMSEKKTTLPSIRNQDWRTAWNRESKRLIDKYPDEWHHGVKRLNIRRSKISLWKNRGPLEDHRQKVKTGWELRLVSQIKRLRQQARILKRKFSDETEKARQLELKKKKLETNQKILAKKED